MDLRNKPVFFEGFLATQHEGFLLAKGSCRYYLLSNCELMSGGFLEVDEMRGYKYATLLYITYDRTVRLFNLRTKLYKGVNDV